ncbi:uncharacterized protein O3C94_015660 [Discoglossus pictus]
MMDENHQILTTMGISGNMSSELHGKNWFPKLINDEGMYEREEKDQVEIHSDPFAGSEVKATVFSKLDPEGDPNVRSNQQVKKEDISVNISENLHDYNLHIVTIKEEREEEDIQQVLEQEEDLILEIPHQTKEEEIPVNIREVSSELCKWRAEWSIVFKDVSAVTRTVPPHLQAAVYSYTLQKE